MRSGKCYGSSAPVNILPLFIPCLRAEKKSAFSLYVHIGLTVIASGFTPSSTSCSRLHSLRSMCHLPRTNPDTISKPAWRNCSYTSMPTSKASNDIPGPMTQRKSCGLLLYATAIALTAFSTIRATVPRHPA